MCAFRMGPKKVTKSSWPEAGNGAFSRKVYRGFCSLGALRGMLEASESSRTTAPASVAGSCRKRSIKDPFALKLSSLSRLRTSNLYTRSRATPWLPPSRLT